MVARAGERAVAARRNAQETRRARARVPRVDGRARARRLARARGSNARHIRRGAGFSFSFRDPARRQISQRKRNYSGRTWTLRAALTFLRAAADLETRRGGWTSVRDRRNRRERRVAPGRAVPAAVVSSRISRLAARPRGDGVEPVFASESGRGTHLSWALTPANWWVAREEAMVTGGGWGVCAEVSRARRAASGSFAAHSRGRENTRLHFSGLPEGVTSERAKWHAIARNGRRRRVFAPRREPSIASRQFDFANRVTAKPLNKRKIHESIQKSRLDAIRFDRGKKRSHSEPLSLKTGCRAGRAGTQTGTGGAEGKLAWDFFREPRSWLLCRSVYSRRL